MLNFPNLAVPQRLAVAVAIISVVGCGGGGESPTVASVPAPAPAPAPTVAPIHIAAGSGYSLAVRADGTVLAWGTATFAAGPALEGTVAHVVSGVSGAGAVAVGLAALGFGKALAIATDGTAYVLATAPTELTALGKVYQVTACLEPNVYGLRADGSVWLQIGASASPIAGLSGIASIGPANTSNSCGIAAVRGDGTVALVDGDTVKEVSGLPPIQQALCSFDPVGLARYCLALSTTGRIWAWGSNGSGQLGDGTTTDRTVPVELSSPVDVVSIGAVTGTSAALTSAGQVYSWGGLGWLGRDVVDVSQLLSPGLVVGLPRVVELASGGHFLVRGDDGSVWGWGGLNMFGELGTGSTGGGYWPVQAVGIDLN